MKKYYYVYRLSIINGPLKGFYYIGQHSTNNLDDNYKSSSKIVLQYIKEYPNSYNIEIICYCKDIIENCIIEKKLICENIDNPFCLNQIKCATNYDRTDEQRKKLSDIAKTYIGEKNPFYGKHHSEDTKKHLSNSHKGKTPWNKGKGDYISGEKNPFYGKHHSEDTRKIISQKAKNDETRKQRLQNTKWIHKNDEQKYVKEDILNTYLTNGWELGMIKKKDLEEDNELLDSRND